MVTPRERKRADRVYLARQKVLQNRIKFKRNRLRKINQALKGKLRPATRQRLLAEKQQLVSDIGALISESKGLTGEFQDLTAPFESEPGSPFAAVDMQSALASLTPGSEDDVAAARERQRIAAGGLAYAQDAFGQGLTDAATVTEWANNLKQANDALESLTGAASQAADLAAAIKELKESIDKQNAWADSVSAIGMTTAMKALGDGFSGQIAGYAGQRARSAGDGETGARY